MPLTTLLRCDDLVATGNYYRETLGFTVSDSPASTITVRLDDCSLIFTEQDIWGVPVGYSGTLYLAISNVDSYYESVINNAHIAWALQDTDYGSREFGLRDCNGYYLAFTQKSVV